MVFNSCVLGRAMLRLAAFLSVSFGLLANAAAQEIEGYSPADSAPALSWGGYFDVGFADAAGDGTSFHPLDARLPADYGVDPFATAVNTRGDVAATNAGDRFTNGF